jgi:hypothetical protein
MTPRARIAVLVFSLAFLSLAGCRSHVIVVTVANHSGGAIHNLEVNYPGGAFGKESLANDGTYTYRIKTLRQGEFAITFEDEEGRAHAKKGPKLQSNAEGALDVEITGSDLIFNLH